MADLDLLGVLQGRVATVGSGAAPDRVDGVTLGVVTDTNDPDGLGRVKVRLPWLSQCIESAWARIAVPWAGRERGTYLLPEVDDEALVAFQHGDVRFPYVVGFLWSEQAPPPERSPAPGRRVVRSRKGHRVVLDDGDGTSRLAVRTAKGHELDLDDESGKVTLTTAGGKITVTLDGQSGSVKVTAGKDLDLDAPNGFVSITGQNVQVVAQNELKLDGRAAVRINS
jgi:uncharacterized protein involved in type VI secretion and phage assembly